MRPDLQLIANWIPEGSSILDVGCGDGTFLKHLQDTRQVQGYGLEIDAANITRCIERGLNVIEQDLNARGLANFPSAHFDVVVMTQALQTIRRPDLLLEEMLRVGRQCIITFPNFAFWKLPAYLLLRGRMPMSKTLPYAWYNTPNIHLCTFRDFESLCHEKSIRIQSRAVVNDDHEPGWLSSLFPNWFGKIAIYQVTQ